MDLLGFLMDAMELLAGLLLLVLLAAILLATIIPGGRLLWRGSRWALSQHVRHTRRRP